VKIEKLLVVDDDEDIRTVTRLTASRVGHWKVAVAASGPEALEAAERERPDVILLDVMMPDMDGPTTLARLREQPCSAETPVIFLTAKAQKHEVSQLRSLGAAGVIRKPFDPAALPDQIRRIVAEL
jgi:CheY-like chemotaxis protein